MKSETKGILAVALFLMMTSASCLAAFTLAKGPVSTEPQDASVQWLTVEPKSASREKTIRVESEMRVQGNEWLFDAEFFVVPNGDTPGPDGTGITMTSNDELFNKTRLFYAEFVPQDLGLNPGLYEIFVHGKSVTTQGGMIETWGDYESTSFQVLQDGPIVTVGPLLDPETVHFSDVSFYLNATISSVGFSGENIVSAEYFVDGVGIAGNGDSMLFVNGGADETTENVTQTFSAEDFIGDYGSGTHEIFVHGRDLNNNWGPFESVYVNVIDDLGPAVTGLGVNPDPTNGAPEVILECVADDSDAGGSDIAQVEYFIDNVGTYGEGESLFPQDGNLNSDSEDMNAVIDVMGFDLGTYVVYVHAQDEAGNWGEMQNVSFNVTDAQPPAFSGIETVANVGTGADLDLMWQPAEDPSTPITYNIYMAAASGGQNFATASYSTTDTMFRISGLTQGQAYYFVVRAEDAAGNEDANDVEESGTPLPDTTPPTFAGVQSVTDNGEGGSLDVSWDAATDDSEPCSYNVYLGQTTGGQDFSTPHASTENLSIMLTGLTNDVEYFVVVRAQDYPGNEDANTVELSATPTFIDLDAPVFDGLANVTDAGTGNSILLEWNATTDPSSPVTYNIYMSQQEDIGSFNFGTASATTQDSSYEYSGLTTGLTYYYVVRAEDTAGNEDGNEVVKGAMVRQPDTTPPSFAGLEEARPLESGTEVQLNWTYATDDNPPIGYNIYYAKSSGGQNFSNPAVTTLKNTTIIKNLDAGTTYYFVVRAEDSRGNEDTNTVERSATLGEAPDNTPPNFGGLQSVIDTQEGGELALGWNPATDDSEPIRYLIYMSQGGMSIDFSQPYLNVSETTGYIVGGLLNDELYSFAVRAQDAHWNIDSNTNTISAVPSDTTPPSVVPVDVDATDRTDELYVSWDEPADNSGIAYYHVFISEESDGQDLTGSPEVNTTQTSATLTGLDEGKKYYVKVVAYDNEGNAQDMLESSGTTASEESTSLLWVVFALCGLLLLIVITVVAILIIAKGRKGEDEDEVEIEEVATLDDYEELSDIEGEEEPQEEPQAEESEAPADEKEEEVY